MTIHGQPRPMKCIALSAMALLFSADALAEWPWFYKSDVVAEVFWQESDILQNEERRVDDEIRVGIEIRQRGFWSDPRIVSFRYSLQPTYSATQTQPDEEFRSELLSYSIGIDVLHGAMAPVEASLNSSLVNNDFRATLGGNSQSKVSQHSAVLRWKFNPFPMEFMVMDSAIFENVVVAH